MNYSLHRTYTLFRTLGLRHLMVVDMRNRICGIITRKDLLPFKISEKLLSIFQLETLSQANGNMARSSIVQSIDEELTNVINSSVNICGTGRSSENPSMSNGTTNSQKSHGGTMLTDNEQPPQYRPLNKNMDITMSMKHQNYTRNNEEYRNTGTSSV